MRQAGTLMMHSMKWLMEQRKGHQPSQPAFRDDAAGRAIHRGSGHPDVLDVFAPALEICGQKRRRDIHPDEILPEIECRDRPQNVSPGDCGQCQLHPDAPADAFVSNRRGRTQKGPHKNERRVKHAKIQLKKRSQAPDPSRSRRLGKRPKFVVSLGREVGMMGLMYDPVEAEAHKAKGADHDAVELIETATFSKEPVGGFVQADQDAVH